MSSTLYNQFKSLQLGLGTPIDLDADTIKLALVTSSYTPNIDTDQYWSTPQANEASGTGYTAGGATLANAAVTTDTTNDKGKFDADDVSWTISSALSARYAVLYKSTGTAGTSPLIGYIDFGSTYSLASGTITITWSANGVITIA